MLGLPEPGTTGNGADRPGLGDQREYGWALVRRLGYRLQAVRKNREGIAHPDRNAQFVYTATRVETLGDYIRTHTTQCRQLRAR